MPSDAVLELGKELVSELGLDQSVDTLGRWMAHYIAELIHEAEHAAPEDQSAKRSECFDAILELWSHRSTLPNGMRPFEDAEPILRAVASLDPEDDTPRYFRSVRIDEPKTEEDIETKKWLDLANGFEHSARLLIRYCLAHAALSTLDKSRAWVKLAEAAGAGGDVESIVIRTIDAEDRLLNSQSVDEKSRKVLENRIARLNEFVTLAAALSGQLSAKLIQAAGRQKKPKVRRINTRKEK